jgi:hypothetical protein
MGDDDKKTGATTLSKRSLCGREEYTTMFCRPDPRLLFTASLASNSTKQTSSYQQHRNSAFGCSGLVGAGFAGSPLTNTAA